MDAFEKKLVILVVLFNKEVFESSTIRTLFLSGLKNAKLIIHNNGPKEILLPDQILNTCNNINVDLEFVNCTSNLPLSILYNRFISSHSDYDKFSILDDDTEVTESFVSVLNDSSYELELPRIIARVDNIAYYPLCNGKVVNKNSHLDPQKTFSIGSGLIFTKDFVDTFKLNKMNVFDESYALYGVDFSLFRRMSLISKKGFKFNVKTSSELLHSLSRTEGADSEFRRVERILDNVVTARRYPSGSGYYQFAKKLVKEFISLRFNVFFVMCQSFFYGKHPRCFKKT